MSQEHTEPAVDILNLFSVYGDDDGESEYADSEAGGSVPASPVADADDCSPLSEGRTDAVDGVGANDDVLQSTTAPSTSRAAAGSAGRGKRARRASAAHSRPTTAEVHQTLMRRRAQIQQEHGARVSRGIMRSSSADSLTELPGVKKKVRFNDLLFKLEPQMELDERTDLQGCKLGPVYGRKAQAAMANGQELAAAASAHRASDSVYGKVEPARVDAKNVLSPTTTRKRKPPSSFTPTGPGPERAAAVGAHTPGSQKDAELAATGPPSAASEASGGQPLPPPCKDAELPRPAVDASHINKPRGRQPSRKKTTAPLLPSPAERQPLSPATSAAGAPLLPVSREEPAVKRKRVSKTGREGDQTQPLPTSANTPAAVALQPPPLSPKQTTLSATVTATATTTATTTSAAPPKRGSAKSRGKEPPARKSTVLSEDICLPVLHSLDASVSRLSKGAVTAMPVDRVLLVRMLGPSGHSWFPARMLSASDAVAVEVLNAHPHRRRKNAAKMGGKPASAKTVSGARTGGGDGSSVGDSTSPSAAAATAAAVAPSKGKPVPLPSEYVCVEFFDRQRSHEWVPARSTNLSPLSLALVQPSDSEAADWRDAYEQALWYRDVILLGQSDAEHAKSLANLPWHTNQGKESGDAAKPSEPAAGIPGRANTGRAAQASPRRRGRSLGTSNSSTTRRVKKKDLCLLCQQACPVCATAFAERDRLTATIYGSISRVDGFFDPVVPLPVPAAEDAESRDTKDGAVVAEAKPPETSVVPSEAAAVAAAVPADDMVLMTRRGRRRSTENTTVSGNQTLSTDGRDDEGTAGALPPPVQKEPEETCVPEQDDGDDGDAVKEIVSEPVAPPPQLSNEYGIRCGHCRQAFHLECLLKDGARSAASDGLWPTAVEKDRVREFICDRLRLDSNREWVCGRCSKLKVDKRAAMVRGKRVGEHVAGLVNIGNSCYINAAVQSLHSLVPFREHLNAAMSDSARLAMMARRQARLLQEAAAKATEAAATSKARQSDETKKTAEQVASKQHEVESPGKKAKPVSGSAAEAPTELVAAGAVTAPSSVHGTVTPPVIDTPLKQEGCNADAESVGCEPDSEMPDATADMQQAQLLSMEGQLNDMHFALVPQQFVDALAVVSARLSEARGSPSFAELVSLKELAGRALSGKYHSNDHEDMIEFLTQALNCLHDAQLAQGSGPASLPPLAGPRFASEHAAVAYRQHCARDGQSFVSRLFDGMTIRARACPLQHISTSFESFRVLSLAFPQSIGPGKRAANPPAIPDPADERVAVGSVTRRLRDFFRPTESISPATVPTALPETAGAPLSQAVKTGQAAAGPGLKVEKGRVEDESITTTAVKTEVVAPADPTPSKIDVVPAAASQQDEPIAAKSEEGRVAGSAPEQAGDRQGSVAENDSVSAPVTSETLPSAASQRKRPRRAASLGAAVATGDAAVTQGAEPNTSSSSSPAPTKRGRKKSASGGSRPARRVRLEDLFVELHGTEQLECRCEPCKLELGIEDNRLMTQATALVGCPELLVLHLGRFRMAAFNSAGPWWANKNRTEVVYPLENLELPLVQVDSSADPPAVNATVPTEAKGKNKGAGKVVSDGAPAASVNEGVPPAGGVPAPPVFRVTKSVRYDLVAVVSHKGSFDKGHYTAVIRGPAKSSGERDELVANAADQAAGEAGKVAGEPGRNAQPDPDEHEQSVPPGKKEDCPGYSDRWYLFDDSNRAADGDGIENSDDEHRERRTPRKSRKGSSDRSGGTAVNSGDGSSSQSPAGGSTSPSASGPKPEPIFVNYYRRSSPGSPSGKAGTGRSSSSRFRRRGAGGSSQSTAPPRLAALQARVLETSTVGNASRDSEAHTLFICHVVAGSEVGSTSLGGQAVFPPFPPGSFAVARRYSEFRRFYTRVRDFLPEQFGAFPNRTFIRPKAKFDAQRIETRRAYFDNLLLTVVAVPNAIARQELYTFLNPSTEY